LSGEPHPAVGKKWPATTYAVGREKIREYARAVGESDARYLDVEVAREAGYVDVVAPPMFAVVYSSPALMPALFDPDVGMNFARMVHGGQSFEWKRLVVAGDELTTTASFVEHEVKAPPTPMSFFRFLTQTVDADGSLVCEGLWTNIVRDGEKR
jgi:acyl dehydratase